MSPTITRRSLFTSLAALGGAARLRAQANKPVIPVRALNHMTLYVSDRQRSIEFYQGLFGMPIQGRQSNSVQLRIGSGPQHVGVGRSPANEKPGIDHFCMTTEGFNVDRITRILADHGVTKSDARGAMKTWVRMRGETPEFYLGDPDGISVQLQDSTYCGGEGVLGNKCFATPEPAPRKGLIALVGLSHFTLSVSNPQRSTAFYQNLFGMRIQTHQGAAPLLSAGPGPQFLTMAGGAANGATERAYNIAHACFTMEAFQPDKVLKTLADYGIKPRGEARGPARPLTSWVSMRMEDRGGAKGGTPELYFSDPDGITLQLQDVSYCGGSGYLGNVCV
jgi:catechol 2,3-dioxygenase-like lactoylglutathione lyase family enzyme